MANEYKRPTQLVELPSGKKVEVVEFLTQEEIREVQKLVLGDQKLSASKMAEAKKAKDKGDSGVDILFEGLEFEINSLAEAGNLAKRLSIKKLIDGEVEYDATDENIRNFFNNEDGEFLDEIIVLMLNPKKKSESEN